MTNIQIIKDRSKLKGTAYVELMTGAYANACWNEGSLFFEEEVFGYIEPTITRYEPTYDHYAFTPIEMPNWLLIVADLGDMRRALESVTLRESVWGHIGFFFDDSERRFIEQLDANCIALADLILGLDAWTRENQTKNDC